MRRALLAFLGTGFACGGLLVFGCGSEGGGPEAMPTAATDAGTDGTSAATDAGSSLVDAQGDAGFPVIPSNFDGGDYLSPAAVPPSADPDVVGAFRFICQASHIAKDDPIVYPGQPGASHLHQFFGNTLANANSTYASLRTTGESTCMNVLNRSAYWMPAMMNGKGKVVVPDYVSIYYKRLPKTSPDCQKQGTECVPLPRGLRYVFGYDMAKPNEARRFHFNCDGPGATGGSYADIPTAAPFCPTGSRIGAVISAPDCWNGVDVDSPDHRSHLAYGSYGDWGYLKCPATHPFVIPTFTLGAWFTTDDDLDRSGTWTAGVGSTWYLASDKMPGMTHTPGSTFHTDWFGAWDDDVMAKWTDNCIDKKLNCSDGVLGNGEIMKRWSGFGYTANPRLVDPPL